jgi:hypothetical protein
MIMAKKKHNKDKKLHNSNELDLSWQEEVDLQPEDEVEVARKFIISPMKTAISIRANSLLKSLLMTIFKTWKARRSSLKRQDISITA